jgi:hypothetical protein
MHSLHIFSIFPPMHVARRHAFSFVARLLTIEESGREAPHGEATKSWEERSHAARGASTMRISGDKEAMYMGKTKGCKEGAKSRFDGKG